MLQNAQSALNSKVAILDIETKALKDAAAALEQARDLLKTTITGIDLLKEKAALDAFANAGGDVLQEVYTDVASAIAQLEEDIATGQTALGDSASSISQVQKATNAIVSDIGLLSEKQVLLAAKTQQLLNALAQAKAELGAALTAIDKTEAQKAEVDYEAAGGSKNDNVYENVAKALVALSNAESQGQAVLADLSPTLAQLQKARTDVTSAQTELASTVAALKAATKALNEWNLAKNELSSAIASVDTATAETAKTQYISASGNPASSVYGDVTSAIAALIAAKEAGQEKLADAASTKEQFEAATEAIRSSQDMLGTKVDQLKGDTQRLVELAKAKSDLQAEIARATASLATAQSSLDNYAAIEGNKAQAVYTDVLAAKDALAVKVSAGQSVYNNAASTKEELDAARTPIMDAMTVLSSSVSALDTETSALQQAKDVAKQALAKAIADVDVTTAQQAQKAFDDKGGDVNDVVYTDVTHAIQTLQQAKAAAQAIDPSTATVAVLNAAATEITNAQEDLNRKTTALKSATDSLILPELTSKPITNLDFSTKYAGQVAANSKPIQSSSFASNRKSFVINDGKNKIPINLTWDIPQNEYAKTYAASVGSAVESMIQDYFSARGELMTRTVGATVNYNGSEQGDTFRIITFATGSVTAITLEGNDWNTFFDTNTFHGTDEDKSANRTFTISDGTKTATIAFNWKFASIDDMVKKVNDSLQTAGVQADAVKVDATTFKVVAHKASIALTAGGKDQSDFFTP